MRLQVGPSFDPVACQWEYGGIVEPSPAPCADSYLTRLSGGGLLLSGVLVLLVVFSTLLLWGIFVQVRRRP